MAVKNWSSSKHPSALNGASYLLLYLVQHVLWNLVSCFSKLHGIFILVPQKFCLCVKARCSGKLDRTGILITQSPYTSPCSCGIVEIKAMLCT